MAKKIYILLTVAVASDGCISYDMTKFNTRQEAQDAGKKELDGWMCENNFVEDGEQEEDYDGNTCRIKHYNDNLVEAIDTMSIAEFDYSVKEFEV